MSDPSAETDGSESPNPLETPAFDHEDTKQMPIYVRKQDLETFEDALDLDLEMKLRDVGIRNVPKREKHSAALEVVADHVDELAEIIVERRIK